MRINILGLVLEKFFMESEKCNIDNLSVFTRIKKQHTDDSFLMNLIGFSVFKIRVPLFIRVALLLKFLAY